VALKAAIAALFIYPVKSCRGIALAAAELTERGLAHDREWMIVDAAGRFVSQRELPALALVRTAISEDALALSASDGSAIEIPRQRRRTPRIVTVWNDTVAAIDEGDMPAAWLSARLGRDVRLVRFDASVRRLCNRDYAGDSGAHTGFADAYPLLVLSEASLADLNARLAAPLPVDRFRPNILLSGCEPYDEDHFEEILTGPVRMKPVKRCTRCRITTTDQETGERADEPLATLSTYRMDTRLDGVAFGVNAIATAGFGAILRLGDAADCTFRF
jgi:hypothetical protein